MSETLSVIMSETSRVVKRDLAVMKITGIIRCEGCGKTGVGVISISRHILFPFLQDADICKVKRDESL